MKSVHFAWFGLFVAVSAAWADDRVSSNGGLATPGDQPGAASQTCVEVEIGGEKSSKLDCINQQLKQQVDRAQPVGNVPPLDAASPAVKLHGFNETALQQQYGKNLGKSVVPFRPTKP